MDERTLEIFRNIAEQLYFDCGGIGCAACAFYSTNNCGMVVIKCIMAKLAGATCADVFQTMSDNDLIEFIGRNPQRKG